MIIIIISSSSSSNRMVWRVVIKGRHNLPSSLDEENLAP